MALFELFFGQLSVGDVLGVPHNSNDLAGYGEQWSEPGVEEANPSVFGDGAIHVFHRTARGDGFGQERCGVLPVVGMNHLPAGGFVRGHFARSISAQPV